MQIIEVKNNIAKISYNSVNNHLLPSDFVLIEDNFLKFMTDVYQICANSLPHSFHYSFIKIKFRLKFIFKIKCISFH